jgi:hypothetical protein
MKTFLRISAVAALTLAGVAFLSGVAADHLLAQWKADEMGWAAAAAGFTLAAINQVLVLPARILSFGSESRTVWLVMLAVGFIGWGLACGALWRRARKRRRSGGPGMAQAREEADH